MNWLQIMKNAVKEQQSILDTAKNEGRNLTDEEKAKIKELTNKITEARENIEIENGIQDANNLIAGLDQPQNVDQNSINNVHVIKNPPKWKNLGEQLQTVINSTITGRIDERLISNAALGINETVPKDGGFLVESDTMSEIERKMWDVSVLASKCARLNVGGNGIKRNVIKEDSRVTGSRYGGIRAYWIPEAGTITASSIEFEQRETKLKKIAAVLYMTEESLEDVIALESIVSEDYPKEMAFLIDDAIFRGDGIAEPLGFSTSSAIVTVAKESGQTADTIVYKNIVKMWGRLWAPARGDSAWLINQDCEQQLLQLAFPGDSSPVYLPPNGLTASPYGTILGRPVIPIEQASTLGDLGDISLVSLSQYELIQKREGIRQDSSIHVQYLTDQRALRFIKRIGGAPRWKTAITPYKGTNTISMCVNLAARD